MTTTARPEVPEMVDLFRIYTADPQSIGSALTRSAYRSRQQDPLIVATSFDIALYPGEGKAPQVEGFRVATRGFTELAGVSHLGPAVASLVSLRERAGDDGRSTPSTCGATSSRSKHFEAANSGSRRCTTTPVPPPWRTCAAP